MAVLELLIIKRGMLDVSGCHFSGRDTDVMIDLFVLRNYVTLQFFVICTLCTMCILTNINSPKNCRRLLCPRQNFTYSATLLSVANCCRRVPSLETVRVNNSFCDRDRELYWPTVIYCTSTKTHAIHCTRMYNACLAPVQQRQLSAESNKAETARSTVMLADNTVSLCLEWMP